MREHFKGKAYSYIRFSSKEQERGDSLRRQTALRDEWLSRHPDVKLDPLVLTDLGVSAFRGKHRGNPDIHALAAFLNAVKTGRVSAGSLLIVESLDRLSREHVDDALRLLLSLTGDGIRIVQLLPVETVYAKPVDPMKLVMAIMELSRGHSESETKSKRVSEAWERKQTEARGKRIVTARCPAWLETSDGKFRFKHGALATLKRIYRRCIEGQGARMIAHDLHKDGVPHFEDGRWQNTYITAILANRAVLGEYQPMRRVNGKRVKQGPPVEGYFPEAISLQEWHQAQKSKASRKRTGGRRGTGGWVALFPCVFDGRTGERLQAIARVDRDNGRRYRVLQPSGVQRWQTRCVSFPIASFEAAIIDRLAELDLAEVLPPTEDDGKAAELAGQLAELESRIARLQAAMIGGEQDEAALPVLRELDRRRVSVAAELATAQQEVASPAREQWGTLKALAATVEKDSEARLRVRAAAARIIERIDVLIVAPVPSSGSRVAVAQIRFADRDLVRSYLIVHENAKQTRRGVVAPPRWSVESSTEAGLPGNLDLRKPDHAARMEKALIRALQTARAGA